MNRSLGIWVLVLLLTGAGIIAMLTHERNAATTRLAKAQAAQHKLEADLDRLRDERDKLRRQLQMQSQAAAELALATAPRKPSPAPAASPTSGSPTGGESSGAHGPPEKRPNPLAEMMKSPAMKEVMKQQQIAALDMQYAGLFSRFHFTDDEKADFKQLLAERLLRESELGIKMLDDITPGQRKALAEEFETAKKAADARIRDFLNNDDDYDAFTNWEETKAERMQIEMGRSLFVSAGEPLSPQQEEQLIGVMLQVRKLPRTMPDLTKPQNFDPAQLTQANIDRQLAQYDANAEAVAAQSAQFLTPTQVEALRTMQQQWRAMSESGMKMTSAMFGPQGKATVK